jgi:predicted nucleotidyltransferase
LQISDGHSGGTLDRGQGFPYLSWTVAADFRPAIIEPTVEKLRTTLGANLYSCLLYGSAVRGDWVRRVSDLNLLLVLEESTPQAHEAIAAAIEGCGPVNPMIVARHGIDRTILAFAAKFAGIRRNYRVLHGADFLVDFNVDPALQRFLVEQALRNAQMRLTRAFVLFGDERRRFTRFLLRTAGGVMTHLSDLLHLCNVSFPSDRLARIPIIERELGIDASILRDLGALKQQGGSLRRDEIHTHYARLHRLLDGAVAWIAQRWPSP